MTKRGRLTLSSNIADAPDRTADPSEEWDRTLNTMAQDALRVNRLKALGVQIGSEPSAPAAGPVPHTVQDHVAVGSALANMATSATQIAQSNAEESRRQADAARQRAEAAETSADARTQAAVAAERERAKETRALLLEIEKARGEAEVARRQADAQHDLSERQRLEDRLDRMEERWQEREAQLEDRAASAERKVDQLRGQMAQRRTGVEELIEAAAQGGNLDEHHLVRLVRALAPSQHGPAIVDEHGNPVISDPNLRYQHEMIPVLVKKMEQGDEWKKELSTFLKSLYGDAREFFGLHGGGAEMDPAQLAAEMAAEAEAGDA